MKMYLKYESLAVHNLCYIPSDKYWRLYVNERVKLDDDGEPISMYKYYLCIDINGEKITLRDPDDDYSLLGMKPWVFAESVPYTSLANVYSDIVCNVAQKLAADPATVLIDIDAIEQEVFEAKHKKRWERIGYLPKTDTSVD